MVNAVINEYGGEFGEKQNIIASSESETESLGTNIIASLAIYCSSSNTEGDLTFLTCKLTSFGRKQDFSIAVSEGDWTPSKLFNHQVTIIE